MAETKPSTTVDLTEAAELVKQIEEHLQQFAGKANHNPFHWAKANLDPLKKAIAAKTLTTEQFAILQKHASEKPAPIVDKNYVAPAKNEYSLPTKLPPPAEAQGLKLPEVKK